MRFDPKLEGVVVGDVEAAAMIGVDCAKLGVFVDDDDEDKIGWTGCLRFRISLA